MHEVEVEVVHAAGAQLVLDERADVPAALEAVGGELVREQELGAVVAGGERLREAAGVVGARGIEVVEAPVEEGVHHLRERGNVDGAVLELGQAHAAKAELAPSVLERRDARGLRFDHGLPLPR